MTLLTRRSFLAGAATAAALPVAMPALGATAKPRIVIVGGGFGGASLARYLRRRNTDIAITLIEKDKQFSTCPFSNGVLGGLYGMDRITFTYDKVKAAGIDVVHDLATKIDPARKTIATAGGKTFGYDYLVLSPGIQFDWGAIEGYDEKAAEIMPHAYMAGPQTVLLRQQLEAMADGGEVVIAVPAMPFRCPPGPYERASMMAWYFKNHKPKSTVTILDASDSFIKQDLFMEAWKRLYPGMIKWVPAGSSGKVTSVDPKTMTVSTDFDDYHPAVANIIPPQKAGQIALSIGLDSGTGWCAIDPITFESKVEKGIYLLGDATIAGEMPKSGFSANNQAMACGRALLAEIAGKAPVPGKLINVCYSTVEPGYAFEIVDEFTVTADNIGLTWPDDRESPLNSSDAFHKREAEDAKSWYANITSEMFG